MIPFYGSFWKMTRPRNSPALGVKKAQSRMPLFEYRCNAGHQFETYVPSAALGRQCMECRYCAGLAERLFPLPNMLQYFSESNGRVIDNLDARRVLHSHGEHQRLMKEKGVEYATQWHTSSMKRTDGLTTKARPGVKTLY